MEPKAIKLITILERGSVIGLGRASARIRQLPTLYARRERGSAPMGRTLLLHPEYRARDSQDPSTWSLPPVEPPARDDGVVEM